tara:strand:- start:56 stop:514 length:459 start_codon:yes stop_codon:yes gene_type:complete
MNNSNQAEGERTFGSKSLDEIIKKLQATNDIKKRYEYVLWLGKKLPALPENLMKDELKVRGCVSQVYVEGRLKEGKIIWRGYSDALITKGLLSLLIEGLSNLTPNQVMNADHELIEATGLRASLTPSRANGFLNILLAMQKQAQMLNSDPTS